jgi:hypothetical protein
LCIPPFALRANVGDNIHNNSHEGISRAITMFPQLRLVW